MTSKTATYRGTVTTQVRDIPANAMTGYCIVFAIFIAGLTVTSVIAGKIIALGPLALPASVFVWALTYPCSDIVAEVYGRSYARKMVLGGFVAYTLSILAIQFSVFIQPASFWPHQEAYQTTLNMGLRAGLASLVSYVVTQFMDVYIFDYIRRKTKGRHLWLRNNGSTFVSQTTANTIFMTLAFWGTIPWENWIQLYTNNLGMRYMLVLSDTALVYAGVHILYKTYPSLRKKKA